MRELKGIKEWERESKNEKITIYIRKLMKRVKIETKKPRQLSFLFYNIEIYYKKLINFP